MKPYFFFSTHIFLIFLLIPIIYTIHRSSHISTKVTSLISLFIFILLNFYSFPNSLYIDLNLLLLYTIVSFLYVITNTFIINYSNYIHERVVNEDIYIYDRYFKHFGFTLDEYKTILMKKGKIIRNCNCEVTLCEEGKNAKKVFLILKLPKNVNVVVKYRNNMALLQGEGSWVGMVELVKEVFSKDNYGSNVYESTVDIVNNGNNKEIVYIEWESRVLMKYVMKYINGDVGFKFMFMWNNSLCDVCTKLTVCTNNNLTFI